MNRHATGWRLLGAAGQLLLSATALLAVTIGIPWGLLVAAGTPWPSPATSLSDLAERLTEPISDPFVIKLLALIAWVCWAAFMASLVQEAYWALRELPTLLRDLAEVRVRLDALPAHRAVAGFLVATVVFALAAMWRPTTAQAHTTAYEPRPATVATAPAVPAPASAGTHTEGHRPQAGQPSTISYTVVPGDTLWDIAKQHLGDSLRWPVIYQLNCHRVQADGHRLRDPDQLSPGWILHLPRPASKNPVPTGPTATRPAAPATAPSKGPVAPTSTPPPPVAPATEHHSAPTDGPNLQQIAPARNPARGDHRSGVRIDVGPASAIGITMAAGIAAAVVFARAHARRRAQPDLTASPPPLAPAVRAARSAHLYARRAAAVAAQPFTDDEEPEEALVERPFPAQSAAAGAIVCAHRAGQELSVDLLAVPGGMALDGPGADAAARALAISVLSAAERLRPAPPTVRLITPTTTARRLLADADADADVDDRPVPAWTVTRDLAEALNRADQALLHRARLADALDDSGAGRSPEGAHTAMDVLICDADSQHLARLAAVARQAMPGQLAVIVVNPGTWLSQVRLAEDGTITQTTGPMAEPLADARMFTLASQPAKELLHVLRAAYGHSTDPSDRQTPHPPQPRTAPDATSQTPTEPTSGARQQTDTAEESGPDDEDAEAHPPAPPPVPSDRQQPQEASPAPITIDILGRFRIRAAGKEKEFGHGMREETREFLSLLAAHPKGIRTEKIADMLNLSPDPEQAARELGNLRRAVRRILRQATGSHHAAFIVRVGDRDFLDRKLIATDFAAFTDAMQRARQTRDDNVRIAALKEAVAAYGGPLCEGADYSWADEEREALHRQAVDTMMLLADHEARAHPHPDQALALLDQAAEWDRHNEAVYQHIIRLQRAAGRDDAAHRTYSLLKRRLAEIGVAPDQATTALAGLQRSPAAAR